MRCLLDTHTFLWAIDDSARLSRRAREVIEDDENDLFLSAASLCEMAIKLSTGKLKLELPFLELAVQKPVEHDVGILQITPGHLDIISRLPFHHRDPFDRLLVAQCLAENIPLLSTDNVLDCYDIERLW